VKPQANLLLALDIGTGSCKGVVYDLNGRVVCEANASYEVQRPAPQWVEQQPEDWWTAVIEVCHKLVDQVDSNAIAGVGLSGQVPTMVLVDENTMPLTPAITWQDRRADAEAAWLRDHSTHQERLVWFGLDLPVDAGWPPARMLWWRRHQPDALRRAHRVLMAKDFVLARLTGTFASDAWSIKGLINLTSHQRPVDFYRRIDVPERIAPDVLPPFETAGRLTTLAAQATGLPEGTPVVTGLSDALCGMVGTGAFQQAGIAFDLTGTSDIVGCSGVESVPGLLHIPSSVVGGVSVLYGPTQSGGDSLTWFAEWTATEIDTVIVAAAQAVPGVSGIVFLPYLNGERAPLWDTTARAAFVGLMRTHTLGDGGRAVMEGVAMSARHILELCGVTPGASRTIRLAGGGTKSDVWNQIRADVLQSPVELIQQANATTLGAAMLAAVGAGLYADLAHAAVMIDIQKRYAPTPDLAGYYQTLYDRFRALYPLLKSLESVPPHRSGEGKVS